MPIYEYGCTKCGKHHEVMQKITEKPLTKCPDCGGTLKKKISNTSFVLKGTGWYVTDYASDKKKSEQKHGGEKKAVGARFESTGPDLKKEGKNEGRESEGKDRETSTEAASEKKSDATHDRKSDSKSDMKSDSKSNPKSDSGKSAASS